MLRVVLRWALGARARRFRRCACCTTPPQMHVERSGPCVVVGAAANAHALEGDTRGGGPNITVASVQARGNDCLTAFLTVPASIHIPPRDVAGDTHPHWLLPSIGPADACAMISASFPILFNHSRWGCPGTKCSSTPLLYSKSSFLAASLLVDSNPPKSAQVRTVPIAAS